MIFQRLKFFLPRNLYGRAFLILLVPIVIIQVVVSYVYIQHHFEGVTHQMVDNVSFEINYILKTAEESVDETDAQTKMNELGKPLGFSIRLDPAPTYTGFDRHYYDFTGIEVIKVMKGNFPNLIALNLKIDSQRSIAVLNTRHGFIMLDFPRKRVSLSAPHQLLVLMLFTAILMTFVSFIFMRNQLKPIKRLSKVAEAFGRGVSLNYQPSGALEVRSAGHAFLAMRKRIENHIEQRTMLLSGVSHDLRTPLTRLRLEVALLEKDDADKKGMLNDILDMEYMLDEFLEFTRGDRLEEMSLELPWKIAFDVINNNQGRSANITILPNKPPINEKKVLLKPIAIRRALENLIQNACEFGTEVRLEYFCDDNNIYFLVSDNGPGIEKKDHDNVMKPFYRLDDARNANRKSGVGLGLAIVADITRSHGGQISLDKCEELSGLKVSIKIPTQS
jgi:two-component system, OmpR family, osmolarity sensor histidine kinase EnvZ